MRTSLASLAMTFVAAIAVASMGSLDRAHAADVIVGAGDGSPTHFNVGRALCRAISKSPQATSCEVERITGRDAAETLAVLGNLRDGTIDMAIAPSDWLYHAYTASGPVEFMDVKFENLRTLLLLHGEPFTVVARRDAGISKLADLAGKRVNIGAPGSDQRVVMQQVMTAMGWSRDSFSLADELTGPEQSLALCHDRIQAMVAIVAHPDAALAKTMALCDAELVEIAGPEITNLIADKPYFSIAEIPARTYENQTAAVKTFGVRVVAVVSEDMPETTAYDIVQAVFGNFDSFKRLHPALRQLRPQDMKSEEDGAPMHPGANRKFSEIGM
ncbi:MAG: TAXI family TRAP transporter solute-binding subunit [Alphaproteobacteria bacterium]